MWQYIVGALALGYLSGSLSSARFVAAVARQPQALDGVQVEIGGSGEAYHVEWHAATTVSLSLGPRWGFLAMVLDMAKVALPTYAVRLLLPSQPYFLLTAAAGMVGHIWPVYFRFRGGGGATAMYGGLIGIDWIGLLVTFFGGMLLGIAVLRNVMVAYLAGFWLLIPWLWFRTQDPRFVAYAVFVNILFMVGLIPQVREYLRLRNLGIFDQEAWLRRTAMGRGMLRVARLFGTKL